MKKTWLIVDGKKVAAVAEDRRKPFRPVSEKPTPKPKGGRDGSVTTS